MHEKVKFIEKIFGPGKFSSKNENYDVKCPICKSEDDNKKKLSINLSKDINHCWVCGWSAPNLIKLLIRFSNKETVEFYKKNFLSLSSFVDITQQKNIDLSLPNDYRLLCTNLNSRDYLISSSIKYLKNRGINDRDMAYYCLGISNEEEYKDKIIIPSFDETGKINFIVSRSIKTNYSLSKYKNCEVKKTEIIFNELKLNWENPLLIVEGPFDLMKCPDNTTCLLGSELNERYKLFYKIIKHSTPIILCLDNDAQLKARKIAKLLMSYNIQVRMCELPPNEDPGSLSKEDMKKIINTSLPLTINYLFDKKINHATNFSLKF